MVFIIIIKNKHIELYIILYYILKYNTIYGLPYYIVVCDIIFCTMQYVIYKNPN